MHIGVDVGTSGTKACAFDQRGNLLAQAQIDYDFKDASAGKREIDPRSFENAVYGALYTVSAALGPRAGGVESITVSSLGEAVVPIDSAGDPLYSFITGTDMRGEKEAQEFSLRVGACEIAKATGVTAGGLYSYGKIAWLKENEPQIFRRAKMFLNVQDYIIRKLCGEASMDESIASRTMLYDINESRWWDAALASLGIAACALPKVFAAGTIVGALTEKAGAQTALAKGIPIVVGAHDHITNALGCGVVEPGWATNATGTTEGLTLVMNARISPQNIMRRNISSEPFAVPGKHCTVAWHNTAGALLKWYRREFSRPGEEDFAHLDELCPKKPTNLLVLPHFSGGGTPDFDAASKGAVLGLTLGSTRYDIFKALMEGSTYELRRILEAMEACGLQTDSVVVCGGGAKSKVWLQMKSDILRRAVRVPLHTQNGALGCCILGAVACGQFASVKDAAISMGGSRMATVPDPENAEIYAERMEQYRKLYPLLSPVSHAL